MSSASENKRFETAKSLMHRFGKRTGISSDEGNRKKRYLWTDAFALLNFLALSEIEKDSKYETYALKIMKEVHHTLGKFAPKDSRDGWISQLSEEEAKKHPTIAGLRIGKDLLERSEDTPYNRQLEWDRDGQYYHYLTRWIMALLKSGIQFNKKKVYDWAAELSLAGSNFIEVDASGLKMFWKISVDLSRPLVPSMGAHDPLEGLICAYQAKEQTSAFDDDFEPYIEKLKSICAHSNWQTSDALGIGGLLLDVVKVAELDSKQQLPSCISPKRLLDDAELGLNHYYQSFNPVTSANYRLAFRECGLSLGLRGLKGSLNILEDQGLKPEISPAMWDMSNQIEEFWLDENNQQASTFQDHLDINEVSLAASLLSRVQPEIYTGIL